MKKQPLCILFIIMLFYPLFIKGQSLAEPSPGSWQIYPRVLVQGTETPLEIRYEHKGKAMSPGEGFFLSLEKLSVSSLFHCPMSEIIEVVPYKGKLPKVDLEAAPVHGVGYRELTITFPEGLKTGESFALRHGNLKPNGDIIALITPFPMKDLGLPVYTLDVKGKKTDWVDAGWFDDIPKCDVVAGDASACRVFVPSIVQCGELFSLKVAITDGLDSRPEKLWSGELQIEENVNITDLPKSLNVNMEDSCFKEAEGLSIEKEGVYRIRVRMAGGQYFESNPVVVREEVDKKIYWGNIHNHGQYSECWGESNERFYEIARKVSGMDYVALSDHIGTVPRENRFTGRLYKWRNGQTISSYDAWENTIEVANKFNDPGRFVTLLGYENGSADAGHYNVYMADASINNMEKMFPVTSTGYKKTINDAVKNSNLLFIPHTHAVNFAWMQIEEKQVNGAGKLLTPVVELYSDWGSIFADFDASKVDSKFGGIRNAHTKSALWAWEQGFKFGTIADSDSHTGMPGRRVVGSPAKEHDHPVGLTAAMTNDYTRQGIMNAYHEMSTYGTTGEHIFLDVKLNGVSMGKELRTDSTIRVFVQIAGTAKLSTFSLYQGDKILKSYELSTKDTILQFSLNAPDFEDQRAYVAEVVQEDENMAWSTPVWVSKYSQPDLAWEQKDGKLFLTNQGTVDALNVKVNYSINEYPFTKPSIPGDIPPLNEEAGYIWTERRDDNRVIFHYRWNGNTVKTNMYYKGVDMNVSDDIYYNPAFYASRSIVKPHNEMLELEFLDFSRPKYYPGFDIIFEVKLDEPAFVEFVFEKEVTTYLEGQAQKGKILRVPINGRISTEALSDRIIPIVRVGQSVQVAGTKGYWSVDPQNIIGESNESNNLFSVVSRFLR